MTPYQFAWLHASLILKWAGDYFVPGRVLGDLTQAVYCASAVGQPPAARGLQLLLHEHWHDHRVYLKQSLVDDMRVRLLGARQKRPYKRLRDVVQAIRRITCKLEFFSQLVGALRCARMDYIPIAVGIFEALGHCYQGWQHLKTFDDYKPFLMAFLSGVEEQFATRLPRCHSAFGEWCAWVLACPFSPEGIKSMAPLQTLVRLDDLLSRYPGGSPSRDALNRVFGRRDDLAAWLRDRQKEFRAVARPPSLNDSDFYDAPGEQPRAFQQSLNALKNEKPLGPCDE